MQVFKDRHGYEWTLDITIGSASEVKKLTGVNLLSLMERRFKPMEDLLNDPVLLIDTLYVLCREQADARTVHVPSADGKTPPTTRPFTDRDFGRCFSGDSLNDAAKAFQEAYLDFFPDPGARSTIREMLKKIWGVKKELMERVRKEVDETDVNSLVEKLRASSGNSPES